MSLSIEIRQHHHLWKAIKEKRKPENEHEHLEGLNGMRGICFSLVLLKEEIPFLDVSPELQSQDSYGHFFPQGMRRLDILFILSLVLWQ
jgi:hypothetical protein